MYLYNHPKHDSELDQRVKLELMTFMQPFPVIEKQIEPIIAKYLDNEEKEEYEIFPTRVLTQDPLKYSIFANRNIRKQLEEVDYRILSISDLDCDDIEKSLQEIDVFLKDLTKNK